MTKPTRLQKINAPNADDVLFIVKTYKRDPVGFAEDVLKLKLDLWQVQFLEKIQAGCKRIAIASGNNAGKTFAVSALAIWFLVTRPQANVFATANTASQLYDVTMNTMRIIAQNSIISNWFTFSQGKIQLIESDTQFISAKPNNAQKPESIQGRHAEHFLQIVDEASAIEPPIWDALNGNCTTSNSIWVVIGNPTRTETPFHKIWKKELPNWVRMNIDTRSCLYASKEWIGDLINEYGENSDIVKVRVKGEFPLKGAQSFLSTEVISKCYALTFEKLVYYHEPVVLGVDVGRQGDYSVIVIRQGRKIHKILKYKFEDDLMALAEKIRDIYNENEALKVLVDANGMGWGVHDRLKQLIPGYNVIAVNTSEKSSDPTKWLNKRQELYSIGKDLLTEGIDLCNDYAEEVTEELSSIETYFDNRNRICVEKKDEIKKKIGRSPDATDALFLALSFKSIHQQSNPKYGMEDEDEIFGINPSGAGGWQDR
jgi:phage terminase large subunit